MHKNKNKTKSDLSEEHSAPMRLEGEAGFLPEIFESRSKAETIWYTILFWQTQAERFSLAGQNAHLKYEEHLRERSSILDSPKVRELHQAYYSMASQCMKAAERQLEELIQLLENNDRDLEWWLNSRKMS